MNKLWAPQKQTGFTIVELLVVIVVIAILASITIVAFNGVQARARDAARVQKVNQIAKAIEMYKADNGKYPAISDGSGAESTCGSQTENWGHCDRNKTLSDMLAPYMTIDPTSLSNATQGNYYYYYTSPTGDDNQSYGLLVYLEGDGGKNDGGYYPNAFEVGSNPTYCMSAYTGSSASWHWSSLQARCVGGN